MLSREQAISYESPTTQSTQKIQAEWPKRGRTNARGRASISTQYNSPLRSQSYIDCDTMDDRHPSRHPPRLSPSTHRNRSVSPAKGTQSRSVSPKKEKQNRSVSPTKGKEALRKDGMKTPSLIEHRFPEHFKEGYLHLLREMRDGFIPLGLKVYYKSLRSLTLLRLTCSQRKQSQKTTIMMPHFTIETYLMKLIEVSLLGFTMVRSSRTTKRKE